MAEKKTGFDLAAALSAVSNLDTGTDGREQIEYIDIDRIDDDPNNFYELSCVDALADNIEMFGLQQPIRVRANPDDPARFIIVSGHRRRAAMRKLVEGGREDLRELPCIREKKAGSAALQELRLIYANSDTRCLTSAEISKQAERVEALLYQLKEEGYDFPGRMRDHVAEACKVSKTKLARLKMIRDNLDEAWKQSYEKGNLAESTAYTLAQMPAEHQQCIFRGISRKNTQIRWFYEYEAKRYGERLAAVDKLICKRGSRKDLPCSNIEAKREQVVYQSNHCGEIPCSKCCDKCADLARCKNACPMLAEKVKKLRADAKAQRQQEKLAQAEKDAPIISEIRKFWNRFGEARNAADKTVKECYKALDMYWVHTDDKKVINLECLKAKFSTNTPMPYGYSLSLSQAHRLVGIADLLGCSLDYLFCRTDNPQGGMTTPQPGQRRCGMTNFQLVTQNITTLDDFISAVVDDALEAKGCSMDLKLPYELQTVENGIFMGWKEWLKQEAEEETVYLPHGVIIEQWKKVGEEDR